MINHYLGDTTPVIFNLKRRSDGTAYSIPSGAVVKASVRKEPGALVAGPFTCEDGFYGAVWRPAGNAACTVVCEIATAHNANISPGVYFLELEISLAGKASTYVPMNKGFRIYKGTIQ
jgi:hypothetical protein